MNARTGLILMSLFLLWLFFTESGQKFQFHNSGMSLQNGKQGK